jgi:tRNA A37 N6-isopentenylltransferase MiaA
MVFDIKRFILFHKETYSWQTELRLQQYADAIIQKEEAGAGKKPVVVTGSMYYLNYRVSLFSHVPVMSQSAVINDLSQLKTREPVSLLVILPEKDLAGYAPFLANKEKKLAGYLNGFYFYTLHADPR